MTTDIHDSTVAESGGETDNQADPRRDGPGDVDAGRMFVGDEVVVFGGEHHGEWVQSDAHVSREGVR